MPSLDPVLTGDAPCRCGRIATRVHCPSCGSYNNYAVKQTFNRMDESTGEVTEYPVFRCRRCGIYYDDWKWRNECNASKYQTARGRRVEQTAQVVADTLEQLHPVAQHALDKIRSGTASPEERSYGISELFKNIKRPTKKEVKEDQ